MNLILSAIKARRHASCNPDAAHRTGAAVPAFRLSSSILACLTVPLLGLSGCRPSAEDTAHDSAVGAVGSAADAPRLAADTVGHGAMNAIADPDQRFLHWMLAHHSEVVYLAHQALQHPDSATVREEARLVDQSYDAETERMRALLRSEFGDTANPGMRQEHAGMVSPFARMSGEAYGAAFRSFLSAHHSEAVRMIDSVSGQLRRSAVRRLATDLRTARERDVQRVAPAAARRR